MRVPLLASTLLVLLNNVYAIRLPMQKRARPSGVPMTKSVASGAGSRGSSATVALKDFQDLDYEVEITLGGQDFVVQLDTGSSDLWVFPNQTTINLTNTTNVWSHLVYGSGDCSGSIDFAEVKLGPYTIPSQAFVNVNVSHDQDPLFSSGASGILGMSFADDAQSSIIDSLERAFGSNTTLGHALITNIFAQNPDTPNCFDVLLNREEDVENTQAGTFLIGEHLDGYEAVTDQPRLYKLSPDRWTVLLDGMAVNGKPFTFRPSSLPDVAPGKVSALLDTGSSVPFLPPAVLDAIYSTIPGAVNVTTSSDGILQYLIPCMSVVNVTFTFGGVEYPVHPLDLTLSDTLTIPIGPNGTMINTTICTNTCQYMSLNGGGFDGVDLILGDACLKNVYASFNMGDATGASNNSYVQLLPRTNLSDAITDFTVSRAATLASMPPALDPAIIAPYLHAALDLTIGATASSQNTPTPSSTPFSGGVGALASDSSSSSNSSYDGRLTSLVEKYGSIAIGLLVANVVIGVFLCTISLVSCLRVKMKSGVTTRSIERNYAPVRSKEQETMAGPERGTMMEDDSYDARYD